MSETVNSFPSDDEGEGEDMDLLMEGEDDLEVVAMDEDDAGTLEGVETLTRDAKLKTQTCCRRCCSWGCSLVVIVSIVFAIFSVLVATGALSSSFVLLSQYRQLYFFPEFPSYELKDKVMESNGFRYTLLANKSPKGRFTSYLRVHAGSCDEPDDKEGLAHFVEHMAFDATIDFPKRGGLMEAVYKSGAASFNAFTSLRNTVYQLWDVPYSVDAIRLAIKIHYNQVNGILWVTDNANMEKGAVLGEGRYRNDSWSKALEDVMINHGGPDYCVGKHFGVGPTDVIEGFSVTDGANFVADHYRPDNYQLIIVGDMDLDVVSGLIEEVWSGEGKSNSANSPKPVKPTVAKQPQSPILVQRLTGASGLWAGLLCTQAPLVHPYDFNTLRRTLNNGLWSVFFSMATDAAFANAYPLEATLGLHSLRHKAEVLSGSEYSFGSRLRLFGTSTAGQPEVSNWYRDMEIALLAVMDIARNGPDKVILTQTMLMLKLVLTVGDTSMTNTELADSILGDLDPNFIFMQPSWRQFILGTFMEPGFMDSIIQHLQGEAQYILARLAQIMLSTQQLEENAELSGYVALFDTSLESCSYNAFLRAEDRQTSAEWNAVDEDTIRSVITTVLTRYSNNPSHTPARPQADPASSPVTLQNSSDHWVDSTLLHPLKAAKLVDEAEEKDLNLLIHSYELANGMHLNIRPLSSQAGPISVEMVSLGGKSVEGAVVMGVCEFLSLHFFSGAEVYHADDAQSTPNYAVYSKEALAGSVDLTGLSCNDEHLLLSATDSDSSDSSEVWEALRLLMRPLFSLEDVAAATEAWRLSRETIALSDDFMGILTQMAIPTALGAAFPADTRLQPVSHLDLSRLLPADIQQWYREQWIPDRVVINVVGDIENVKDLVEEINLYLGSYFMPFNENTPIVGLDLYASAQEDNFKRNLDALPLNSPQRLYHCAMPSLMGDRAFVSAFLPAYSAPVMLRTGAVGIVGDDVIRRTLYFNAMRRDHGFGYFAIVAPFHSAIFPDFSYYQLVWAPGTYPPDSASVNDTLNVQSSLRVAAETAANSMPEEAFAMAYPNFLSNLQLPQTSAAQLKAMRHLWMRTPAVFRGIEFLQSTSELVAQQAGLSSISFDDVSTWLQSQMLHEQPEDNLLLHVVVRSLPPNGAKTCSMEV
jgi:predicted Zn-dependent peptidase